MLTLPGLSVAVYGQGGLKVGTIVANVRKAIGVNQIKKQKRGFAVEESVSSGPATDIAYKYFGPNGEVVVSEVR